MSTRTGLVLVREGAAAAQAEDEVQRGLLLYVVVGESAPVLELLPGEDEALLVGGGCLLALDLLLHVLDGVRRLHAQRDRVTRELFTKICMCSTSRSLPGRFEYSGNKLSP